MTLFCEYCIAHLQRGALLPAGDHERCAVRRAEDGGQLGHHCAGALQRLRCWRQGLPPAHEIGNRSIFRRFCNLEIVFGIPASFKYSVLSIFSFSVNVTQQFSIGGEFSLHEVLYFSKSPHWRRLQKIGQKIVRGAHEEPRSIGVFNDVHSHKMIKWCF